MKYTEEKPKKAGWYWFRYWRNSDEPIEYIVRVYESFGDWWADHGEYSDELAGMDGEFAGPVEKAED